MQHLFNCVIYTPLKGVIEKLITLHMVLTALIQGVKT